MGFAELFSQPPAPIEERMAAGVPQAPVVQAAPMVNPAGGGMPPAPQQMQAQAGSTQAPAQAPDPKAVGRWEELLSRITQPDVMGPLQTFLAAAAAPLQPGENMGARLGYAGTLMQLHRSMLQENARLAPQLAEERELKLQEMRGKIAQTEAATETSKRTGQKVQQEMDWQNETKLQRIDLLDQQIAAAKAQGNAAEAQRLEAEQKRLLDVKWGDKKTQADIDVKNAQAGMYNRSPKAGGDAEDKVARKSDLENQYEMQIWAPYVEWAKTRAKDPGSTTAFNDYLNDNPTAAALYKVWSKEYQKVGGKMQMRKEPLGKSGGKRFTMGADGQLKEAK